MPSKEQIQNAILKADTEGRTDDRDFLIQQYKALPAAPAAYDANNVPSLGDTISSAGARFLPNVEELGSGIVSGIKAIPDKVGNYLVNATPESVADDVLNIDPMGGPLQYGTDIRTTLTDKYDSYDKAKLMVANQPAEVALDALGVAPGLGSVPMAPIRAAGKVVDAVTPNASTVAKILSKTTGSGPIGFDMLLNQTPDGAAMTRAKMAGRSMDDVPLSPEGIDAIQKRVDVHGIPPLKKVRTGTLDSNGQPIMKHVAADNYYGIDNWFPTMRDNSSIAKHTIGTLLPTIVHPGLGTTALAIQSPRIMGEMSNIAGRVGQAHRAVKDYSSRMANALLRTNVATAPMRKEQPVAKLTLAEQLAQQFEAVPYYNLP